MGNGSSSIVAVPMIMIMNLIREREEIGKSLNYFATFFSHKFYRNFISRMLSASEICLFAFATACDDNARSTAWHGSTERRKCVSCNIPKSHRIYLSFRFHRILSGACIPELMAFCYKGIFLINKIFGELSLRLTHKTFFNINLHNFLI